MDSVKKSENRVPRADCGRIDDEWKNVRDVREYRRRETVYTFIVYAIVGEWRKKKRKSKWKFRTNFSTAAAARTRNYKIIIIIASPRVYTVGKCCGPTRERYTLSYIITNTHIPEEWASYMCRYQSLVYTYTHTRLRINIIYCMCTQTAQVKAECSVRIQSIAHPFEQTNIVLPSLAMISSLFGQSCAEESHGYIIFISDVCARVLYP